MNVKNIISAKGVMRVFLILIAFFFMAQMSPVKAAAPGQGFNHFSTGFPLEGTHQSLECSTCHLYGVFKGLSSECTSCHEKASRVSASSKSAVHIITSDKCETCHIMTK